MKITSVQLILCFLCAPFLACSPPESNGPPSVLVFHGKGTSANSAKAIEAVLKERHLNYATANSSELNAMSASELTAYRLLIVPGGNYITMGNSLTPDACARVRDAVRGGVNYLGICAGGLLAGKAPSQSFDLTDGVRFDFYAVVNQGIHKTAVAIAGPDQSVIEHYWEDGPQFTGWGEIVGRYPDQTPAIVEGKSGQGWVVLCGVHPEAPENWRRGMRFSTPAREANAYAGTLIDSAVLGTPLPHF